MKVIGWILLVVGVLGTAANLAYIAIGDRGRIGFLVFGISLVALGLWLARSGKRKESQ